MVLRRNKRLERRTGSAGPALGGSINLVQILVQLVRVQFLGLAELIEVPRQKLWRMGRGKSSNWGNGT